MGKLFFALFVIVPFVEVYLLVLLGNALGFWPTILLILVTAALGAALGKREGLRVWGAWREALAAGRLPEEGVLGGVLVLVGGVLLITPGVLSDVTGLALLFPPSRRFIAKHVQQRMEKRMAQGQPAFQFVHFGAADVFRHARPAHGYGDVIDTDGEVVEERRPNDAKPRNVLR